MTKVGVPVAVAAVVAGAFVLTARSDDGDAPGVPGFSPGVLHAADCDRVISPSGGEGRGAQDLVDALAPGETGCLAAGTYDADEEIRITTPRITLAPLSGEQVTLRGRIWIVRGADGVTVEGLRLEGRNEDGLPSPTVNADRATFRGNDVTNGHTGICFAVGDDTYGRAAGTLIEANRIHGCGRMPRTNHDHGIYVAHAEGTTIRRNWIYDNADRGIQMYPEAHRTVVRSNVIDSNGEGVLFGGNDHYASSGNVVRANAITNSLARYNVEANWPAEVGARNVVTGNCIAGGARDGGDGGIEWPQVGFVAVANVAEQPRYADRAARDYRILAGGRCGELLARME